MLSLAAGRTTSSPPFRKKRRYARAPVAEPPGDPKGYALAEGKRALTEQADVLKDTRDRVGTVVSAAAVVVGLGLGFAFNSGDRAGDLAWYGIVAAIVAALAFAGVALSAAMIWRPLAGAFVIDAGTLVGSYLEGDPAASLVEMHRELGVHSVATPRGIVISSNAVWSGSTRLWWGSSSKSSRSWSC